MAHTYNPSYSGGRDWDDCGSKPAPGKNFMRPYLKKPNQIDRPLANLTKMRRGKNPNQ
jgi:hypothetical protein